MKEWRVMTQQTNLVEGVSRRRALELAGAFAVAAVAGGARTAGAQTNPLRIGIIGTGRIGGALARHWTRAGHEVLMSSRHPDELRPLAKELGPRARVGTPREAAPRSEERRVGKECRARWSPDREETRRETAAL